MVHSKEPAQRRRTRRRLFRRGGDLAAARAGRAAQARWPPARTPHAGARRRAAVCGRIIRRADRTRHLGRVCAEPQCAGRDGLSARGGGRGRRRVRRTARPAPAASHRADAVRSQHLQTLKETSMSILYTSDHEWLRIEGDTATIGITEYAQSQLGDVVFVELPKVGRSLKKAEAAAVVESVKAASDVYAPISGEVVEVNDALSSEPALVNSDAAGKAWFFKVKIADRSELEGLMDEAAYKAHTA